MTLRPLVIAGAGGFARETAELVRAINDRRPTWHLAGYVDDDSATWGNTVSGLQVLGGTEWLVDNDATTVICIGSPANFSSRAKIVERLGLDPERYATLVHPSAAISPSTTIGEGTVVTALCAATADVSIGAHVAVMPSCVFTHDDVIESFTTFGAGVRLAGRVTIGAGAYVGAGAMVRENRTIGSSALIGMGSVVTSDVPADEVWAGVPARRLRSLHEPAALHPKQRLGDHP